MTETSPEHRFSRSGLWENWPDIHTDQNRGPAAPPLEKRCINEFTIYCAPVGKEKIAEPFEEGDAS